MYATKRFMKYSTTPCLDYVHQVVDGLVEMLAAIGVEATGKKWNLKQDLRQAQIIADNAMPSWVSDNAQGGSSNVTYIIKNIRGGDNINAGMCCFGCVYWEVDNVKYAFFMGGMYDQHISNYIGITLSINFTNVEGTTNSNNENILLWAFDNSSSNPESFCWFGWTNLPDYLSVCKHSAGFHFYLRGRNGQGDDGQTSRGNNISAGHTKSDYDGALVIPIYGNFTKKPSHINLGTELIVRSLASELKRMMNPVVGDIVTGKHYLFDLYYGIKEGTIIGRSTNVYAIPTLTNVKLGQVANLGGIQYMKIGHINSEASSYFNIPVYVRAQ